MNALSSADQVSPQKLDAAFLALLGATDPELRASPKPVIIVLALLGVGLSLLGDATLTPQAWTNLGAFIIVYYVLLGVAWLLDSGQPMLSRWCVVLTTAATIVRLHSLLHAPALLGLLVLPAILAAALLGLRSAALTAVAESVLLLRLPTSDQLSKAAILLQIWGALGAILAMSRPVQQRDHWLMQYFEQAQHSLESARDRTAAFAQTLKDLAQANEQLNRLNLLARTLRQEAEEARTSKEQFVAMVSHELRTPLNMIIGFSEMIVQTPRIYGQDIPASLLADLEIVLRNAQHLSRLVDDVLDLSQIEARQMALTRERISLPAIAEAAMVAVRPLYESRGLFLRLEAPEDLPPVYCDPTRIRQVVLNLLSNAGRFTERGGVCLRIRQDGADLLVAVADSGPGIPAKDMGRIWQPFQQLDSSSRRRFGGTGLGLAISKQFIELHGGEIWAESEENVGTTCYFRLPIDPPVASGSTARWFSPYLQYEEQPHLTRMPVFAGRARFLVLEEGASLERLLSRYLDGTEIVRAATPQEAARQLQESPAQALLINDPAPEETLRALGERVSLPPGMPIITCCIPGIRDAAGALGVTDYLVKPVSRDLLLQALDRLHLTGKVVLLVDDEPDALRLFRRVLISSGRNYRIHTASDGEEALRLLREGRPDAVLLDLVMPNLDGFALLAEKNRDSSLRGIPVIVVSARDPMGQPIVSKTLTVTQSGGLSVPQILRYVEAIAGVRLRERDSSDPVPKEKHRG